MIKSNDVSRLEISDRMIQEIITAYPDIQNELKSKFDTEFLNEIQKNQFADESEAEDIEADSTTASTLLITSATIGAVALGVYTYYKLKK